MPVNISSTTELVVEPDVGPELAHADEPVPASSASIDRVGTGETRITGTPRDAEHERRDVDDEPLARSRP